MTGVPRIEIPTEKLAELCRRHHIRQLSLFGSVLRGDFTDASDIDVLVDFEEGHLPGLRYIDVIEELAEIFGRNVDVATPRALSRYIVDRVMSERRVIYDAA
jgi:hypothetical protein